jgi:hypothetical protein
MSSVLHMNVTPYLNERDQLRCNAAELVAHNAAMSILEGLRQHLPPHLKPFAEGIAMTGLFSAFGRIAGEHVSPANTDQLLSNIGGAAEAEIEHWRNRRVRH